MPPFDSTRNNGQAGQPGQPGQPRRSGCAECRESEPLGFDFDFAFQPIVDVDTGIAFAQEALVRGLDGAGAMSVLAQVNDANRYRFDQACRVKAVGAAKRLGLDGAGQHVSINFMPNAVYRPASCIRTTIEAALACGFPLSNIIFEVTEVEKIEDRAHLARIIETYRDFGFLTAIDDFGAGYAGLNLLAEYQPDYIKIDLELIRDVDRNKVRQAILRGILAVAHDLGILVIAEGIESTAERDWLRDAGVRLMQGYLFARPLFRGVPTIAEGTCGRVDA